MRTFLLVVTFIPLAGCVSSGVIPMDEGTYMVTKTSAGCGLASADGPKADVYLEANEYCTQQKKKVQTIKFTGRNGIPFARCASAELQFRCVDGK